MKKKAPKKILQESLLSKLLCQTALSVIKTKGVVQTLLISIIMTFLFILLVDNYLYFTQAGSRENLELGDLVEIDYYAEQSFRFIDHEGTKRLTNLRLASLNGIFVKQQEITRKILDDIGIYSKKFEELDQNSVSTSSFQALGVPLTNDQIDFLLKDKRYENIINLTGIIVSDILNSGYYKLLNYKSDPSFNSGVIEVISTQGEGGIKTIVPMGEVLTEDNIDTFLVNELSVRGIINEEQTLTLALIKYFLKENCYFNEKMTSQKRKNVLDGIAPLYITVNKGDKIIGAGEVVTSNIKQKLDAYWALVGRFKVGSLLKPLSYLFGILLLGILFICYLPIPINNIKNFKLLLWSIPLFTFFIVLLGTIIPLEFLSFSYLIIPTGLFTLLISQLVTEKKGVLIYAFILSLLAFFITGLDPYVFIYSLVTGLAGTLVLTGGEKRIDILKSGIWLGSINLVASIMIDFVESISLSHLLFDGGWAFISGIFYALLVLSLLPLFEHFINSCTAYRLAELANLNEPILKRLFIQAAGTYVHSINVAYMAEPACEAIGCNSLLARVGAYYHDIGKMDQPHFFIENQKDENKHDELKANLSVAIIKAHVKLGVEKAREMGLPLEVIQIIGQHHGTSVIKYFYDKAEKEIKESGKSSLNRDNFCHFGPRPQSKEAAVVMLADSIEAASRTLKKPSRAKLEKYVWDLIMDRLQSGELNDSGLTLNELEKIKDKFVHVLIGHFHSRIEYPDQKKEEEV
jgi:putative nucleotidyltransferase with HDIG domain